MPWRWCLDGAGRDRAGRCLGGCANRSKAALNFVLYTMGGSVFMLIRPHMLYDLSSAHTFDVATLRETGRTLGTDIQVWLFLALLIGFGLKMPILPLHGWLPLTHVEAPSPASIVLSSVLLKMGGYGLIRAARSLSDLSDRREPSGRARTVFHEFEAHSGPMQREIGEKWTAIPPAQ